MGSYFSSSNSGEWNLVKPNFENATSIEKLSINLLYEVLRYEPSIIMILEIVSYKFFYKIRFDLCYI